MSSPVSGLGAWSQRALVAIEELNMRLDYVEATFNQTRQEVEEVVARLERAYGIVNGQSSQHAHQPPQTPETFSDQD